MWLDEWVDDLGDRLTSMRATLTAALGLLLLQAPLLAVIILVAYIFGILPEAR